MAERLSLFRKCTLVIACRALGIPVILHLHAAQLHHFYQRLPSILKALTRWVFSIANCCLVLGTASRQFVSETLKVPSQKIQIITNGVPEPTLPRRQPSLGKDTIQQILFVGNLSARKGVSDLLEALALPGFDTLRVKVTLAGGGDLAAYQAQARRLGLEEWVHFSGWSNQAQVAQLMAHADVLVLPSYDEGLPLVILEALANGVAVVCTPVGEIPSVLTDNENASFVQAGDLKGIAAALQKVLRQTAFRQKLERNGRALYLQKFSLSRFFSDVARIHQQNFGVSGVAQGMDEVEKIEDPELSLARKPSASPLHTLEQAQS
jgi:glycosyltransferase involved in cell wall biosynthesis